LLFHRACPGGYGGCSPRAKTVLFALVAVLSLAGCVSMPSAGPVQSYPVTQGVDAQGEPYQQVVIGPPVAGWSPAQIVQGFLAASASFGNNWQVAREYMTPQESKLWSPSWSAIVYSNGPNVQRTAYTVPAAAKPDAIVKSTAKRAKSTKPEKIQATVTITGSVLAGLSGSSVSGYGSYAVPSGSTPQGSPGTGTAITLVKMAGGEWRIASAPTELLLTSDAFKSDYELRNLYFFDPTTRFLVPDPVYVPLQATPADLMNGLVYDLVKPPKDWLADGATRTAFPAGTTFPAGPTNIGAVTIEGVTAVVDLGGAITKASTQVMQQVSAQLVWTLSESGQSGQSVQSVELEVNGKPWLPPGNTQGNPVQRDSKFYNPAPGTSKTFYYLDASGNVTSSNGIRATPVRVAHVGTGYTQLAVSPDGKYLALIRKDGDLFSGPLDGTLTKRGGSLYSTLSWDPNDDLWATMNNQVVMLRGAEDQAQPIAASVLGSVGSSTPMAVPFTSVRVAPDGVRVAVVIDNSTLVFGAISWQAGTNPQKPMLQIVLSPFDVPARFGVTFTSLTWYGPDNVITLTEPGPAVTEYPVNGGAATSISATALMQSITASPDRPLIAGLAKGRMADNASLTGSWMPIANGVSPAYPG
jgi:Lipoprotein LpqB beta-propeller domain/Sporulation and spore germination